MGKGKSKKQKAKSNSPQRRKGRKVRTLPDNRRYQYFKAEDNSLCARAVPVAFRETPPVLQENPFFALLASLR
jgi:hypothetical protein